MSGLSMIDSKRGGNFQLVLKRIEYEIKDTREGEKYEIFYIFEIRVKKIDNDIKIFSTKVKAKNVKNPNWVINATNGMATLCNTKELKSWFESMIQINIESNYVKVDYVYPTCGWRKLNGKHFYTYSKGAIGAENFGIIAKRGYDLLIDANRIGTKEIFEEAWNMRKICKKNRVSSLIFTYFHIGLLTKLFEEAGYPVNFLMGVIGETGSRKTSICTTMTKVFNRHMLSADIEFTATEGGIEEQLSKYNDAIVLIDDFVAGQTRQEQREANKKLHQLIRFYGNRISKGRMGYNISEEKKPFYPISGCCILTGEYITGITSSIGRVFTVNIGRDDVNNKKLLYFQNNREILPTYAYDFLEWIAYRYEDIKQIICNILPFYRKNIKFKHSRYCEMYATFITTLEIMLMYACEKYHISVLEKNNIGNEIEQIIIAELRDNERMIMQHDIGAVLIASLMEAINNVKLKIKMIKNSDCYDLAAIYQDEYNIYIQSKEVGRIFKEYVNKYNFDINLTGCSSIASHLEAKDVLEIKINSDGSKERARKLPIQKGNAKRYLWINKQKLLQAYVEYCEQS